MVLAPLDETPGFARLVLGTEGLAQDASSSFGVNLVFVGNLLQLDDAVHFVWSFRFRDTMYIRPPENRYNLLYAG